MWEILDTLVEEIVIACVLGGVLYVMNHFRKKSKETDEIKEELRKQRKAIWKIHKTITIFAKIIDAQTEKNHPEVTTQLEDITEELLEDNGN